jgi:hypothetical protein
VRVIQACYRKSAGEKYAGSAGLVSRRISTIARRSAVDSRAYFGAASGRQDAPHPRINGVARRRRGRVERVRIDHVAARVAQQPRLEIELPQRTAAAVGRAAPGELRGKARRAGDGGGQRRLVDEQQVVDQLGDQVVQGFRKNRGARGDRGEPIRCGLCVLPGFFCTWIRREDARVPADARQQVGHVHLVLEHQQRDEVAVRREIVFGVDAIRDRVEVEGVGGDPCLAGAIDQHRVAEVDQRAVTAGHVIAGPAVVERRPMIGRGVAVLRHRRAGRRRRDAAHQQPGHFERRAAVVARQAEIAALDHRLLGRALIERVEHDPLPRILRGEFQELGAMDEAERHGVVEVDRPRIARGDSRRLDAGLREQQQLRGGRHAERLEHRRQIPVHGIEGQRGGAALEIGVEPRDPVGGRGREVGDRGLAHQVGGEIRELAGRRGDCGQRQQSGECERVPPPPQAPCALSQARAAPVR